MNILHPDEASAIPDSRRVGHGGRRAPRRSRLLRQHQGVDIAPGSRADDDQLAPLSVDGRVRTRESRPDAHGAAATLLEALSLWQGAPVNESERMQRATRERGIGVPCADADRVA
jgi:hypothetical protein